MPRYRLAIDGREGAHERELATVQAAKCEAIQLIADTLCKDPQAFWAQEDHRVTVTDASGLVLFLVDIMTVTSPVVEPRRPIKP